MKGHVHLLLHLVERRLPGSVTMFGAGRRVYENIVMAQESAGPGEFTALRGAPHDRVAGMVNHPLIGLAAG